MITRNAVLVEIGKDAISNTLLIYNEVLEKIKNSFPSDENDTESEPEADYTYDISNVKRGELITA